MASIGTVEDFLLAVHVPDRCGPSTFGLVTGSFAFLADIFVDLEGRSDGGVFKVGLKNTQVGCHLISLGFSLGGMVCAYRRSDL